MVIYINRHLHLGCKKKNFLYMHKLILNDGILVLKPGHPVFDFHFWH